MTKINRNLMVILSVLLVIGIVLVGGCGSNQENTTQAVQVIENKTIEEASVLVQENQNSLDFVIIDVRTAEEFGGGYIENAVNIDYYSATFRDDLDELDKDKIYLLYCVWGGRSGAALAIMEELGFLEAYNLSGGILAWQDAGLPVVTE